MAHLWAKWLRHPCRLRDPHRFRAGGGGNQKWPTYGQSGYVTPAVSGIPTAAERGGQNQKWPTCGQRGYVTLAVSRIPTASERGGKIRSGPVVGKVATSPLPSQGSPPLQSGGGESEVAHLWAKWLRHPCRLRDPHRFGAGGKIRSGPLVGKVATSPLAVSGIPTSAERGGKIRSGPLMGKRATPPLPSRGSPPLQSGGQNQKWPTCGQSGYVTPAVSGIPTASERWGGKSEVSHLWAKWLRHPCRLGDTHRCRAGEGNQKWPTYEQKGYATPAVSGIPTASERWAKSEVSHLWAKWLRHPCRLGDTHRCRAGEGNQKWPTYGQKGYVTPAVSGIPTASEAGGKIRSGPRMGKVATSPLPSPRSPPLQSGGGRNQKWPTYGQGGYVTPAVSEIPTASERGAKSEVAHLWAKWLRHPCRLGDPHRCRAGGSKSEVAHLWATWLRHPCRLGDPHRFRAGGQNQKWPTCRQSGYVTPAVSGIPTAAERGGGNQKWPTYGQSGYVTPAVSGIPTASERGAKSEVAHLWAKWLRQPLPSRGSPPLQSEGAKSEVAHLWAKWLRHPCHLGDPHRCRAGEGNQKWPLMGNMATSPVPSRGSPPLQSEGQNQKWPTYGQGGYVTLAVSGIPTASERGAKSEVAHLWAKWLRHPCHLGDPHRFRAGDKIRSGPLVGKVATSPLPSRGSPPLQSGGEITSGPLVGNVATSPLPSRGSPPLQSGGAKSEVAQL